MEEDSGLKTLCKLASSWKECREAFKSSPKSSSKDSTYEPPMAVIEFPDKYQVILDVPRKANYHYGNIKIQPENDSVLVISRSKNLEDWESVPDEHATMYLSKELDKHMVFEKKVELCNADLKTLEADHNNYGELTVTVKKFPPRNIEANVNPKIVEFY